MSDLNLSHAVLSFRLQGEILSISKQAAIGNEAMIVTLLDTPQVISGED